MDKDGEEKTFGIDDDMAFAALHFLAGIKARNPAAFSGLDRLAVDDPGAWRDLPAQISSLCQRRK